MMAACCYLLCAAVPYPRGRRPRHYAGRTKDLDARLTAHKNGTGAKFTAALRAEGITFDLVRTWDDGSYEHERSLKRRHRLADLCPRCKAAKKGGRK